MGLIRTIVLVILLNATIVLSGNPSRYFNKRIVDGQPAAPGQFPFQALLLITLPQGRAICGGTLLNNEWVITAAHCVRDAQEIEIHLGAQNYTDTYRGLANEAYRYNHTEPGRAIDRITTKIVHPNYNQSTAANDLALIKLSQKIDFTDLIQPALLPKSSDIFVKEDVIASGWQLKYQDNTQASFELQWADMQMISYTDCVQAYNPWVVHDTTICVKGNKKQNVCSEDSGGPLVLKSDNRTLIGVESFGRKAGCNLGIPQGFSSVTSYLQWIQENIGNTAK